MSFYRKSPPILFPIQNTFACHHGQLSIQFSLWIKLPIAKLYLEIQQLLLLQKTRYRKEQFSISKLAKYKYKSECEIPFIASLLQPFIFYSLFFLLNPIRDCWYEDSFATVGNVLSLPDIHNIHSHNWDQPLVPEGCYTSGRSACFGSRNRHIVAVPPFDGYRKMLVISNKRLEVIGLTWEREDFALSSQPPIQVWNLKSRRSPDRIHQIFASRVFYFYIRR